MPTMVAGLESKVRQAIWDRHKNVNPTLFVVKIASETCLQY
jgi:hypothetical protein